MSTSRPLFLLLGLALAACGPASPRTLAELKNPVFNVACFDEDDYGLGHVDCSVSVTYDGMPDTCAEIQLSGTLNGAPLALVSPGAVESHSVALFDSRRTCSGPQQSQRLATRTTTLDLTLTDGKTHWAAQVSRVCPGYFHLESAPPVKVGGRVDLSWVGASPLEASRVSFAPGKGASTFTPDGLIIEPARLSFLVPQTGAAEFEVRVKDPSAVPQVDACTGPSSCQVKCGHAGDYPSLRDREVWVLVPVVP